MERTIEGSISVMKPTKLENWPSRFQEEWVARDYFVSPDGEKEFPDHHCKMTWEISKPFIKDYNGNAIDVGCRDGEYARYLHTHFNHTYCFDMRWRKKFVHNVDISKVTHWTTALGDGTYTTEATGGVIKRPAHPKKKPRPVDVRKLDDFKIENVKYIKLDVEGFELKCIKGGLETIKRDWPLMIVEQNDRGKEFEATKFLINELGYKHVATCPRGWDWVLIKE